MIKRAKQNYPLQKLIMELKKKSIDEKSAIWKRVAIDLEKPSRQRRIINLSRIDAFCKDNETIIVPGKVLADGDLNKKVNIAAFSFSKSAKDKILQSKCSLMTIEELMKKGMKSSELRIIG